MENPGYSYYLSEFKILLNTIKEREDWDEATFGRFISEIIRLTERDWALIEDQCQCQDPLGYTE